MPASTRPGRINPLGEDDNWWSNGPTGPCGPDTEIFVWVGDGDPPPFADIPEYVEIWNNVFMTLQPRRRTASSRELPQRNVDTGMGLERIALFLNGHTSVWQTDELARLLEVVAEPLGVTPERARRAARTRSLRIVTDHLRASLAIAAAGIRPVRHPPGLHPAQAGPPRRAPRRAAARHRPGPRRGAGQGDRQRVRRDGRALARRRCRGAGVIWPARRSTRRPRSSPRRCAAASRTSTRSPTRPACSTASWRSGSPTSGASRSSCRSRRRRAWGCTIAPDWNERYEELREQQRAALAPVTAAAERAAGAVARGLTSAEVAERVANGQVNTVVASAGRSTAQIIRANVFTLFNLIVGALFVVMLIVGPLQDAAVRARRHRQHADRHRPGAAGQAVAGTAGADRSAHGPAPAATARCAELQPDDVVLDDVLLLSSGTQAVVDGDGHRGRGVGDRRVAADRRVGPGRQAAWRPGDVGQLRRRRHRRDAGHGGRRRRLRRQAGRTRPAGSSSSTARSVPTSTGC